ncbi:MAG: DNA methyltransferase [Bacteroidetes bacterium]|nr:MAG: DNA methyltransferase [Bacteroidota bacterium]
MITQSYIQHLNATYQQGKATEHSYRPHLHELLTTLLPAHAITYEPKHIDCGAPDYIITSLSSDLPVAFIEAKDIGDPDLDGRRANREQFTRYKEALENLIFTDYLDFHVYQGGEFVDSVRIGEVKGGRIVYLKENEGKFCELVVNHIKVVQPQGISSPKALAQIMAGKARLLAQTISLTLQKKPKKLTQWYTSLKKVLINDLEPQEFADIYAQTITYGLFAARLHHDGNDDFTRRKAAELIPETNPFLLGLFEDLAGGRVDSQLAWIVDDLASTFNHVNTEAVMGDGTHDPIVHFYEDFLAAYNPALRKAKGVWYTPQPVVSFMVRAVDDILIGNFGLPKGLADSSTANAHHHRVQILDPATGTGTFLVEIVRQIHTKFRSNKGAWQSYVEQHLIPRLYGFEILMAPYAIAHLKLSHELQTTGYTHQSDERLRIYLTNSLEEQHQHSEDLFSVWLAAEAEEANAIKRDTPVMVMMGNPPYSVSSSNKSQWILDLIEGYKPEGERNIQPLSDDYIKFIRLGHSYIERTGEGVLAYICNSSFLDGIIHQKMRRELLKAFDDIYILNLHGDAHRKEICPDGGKDENVFDITPGVSINIFVRHGEPKVEGQALATATPQRTELAQVHYHSLMGSRQFKYNELDASTLASIPWEELQPIAPYYFFVPKDFALQEEYDKNFSLEQLFSHSSVGALTSQDGFVICDSTSEVQERIQSLIELPNEELKRKYNLKDSRDWSIERAKADVGPGLDSSKITRYAYRPFDTKFLYYTGTTNGIVARPRFRNFLHLLHPQNIALIAPRQCAGTWRHAFASRTIADKNLIANAARHGAGNVFPLYRLEAPSPLEQSNAEEAPTAHRLVPNLNPAELARIEQSLGEKVEPQELFDYIYAILHSPTYREKYQEFLKIDFPRIPYPTDVEEYQRLAGLGRQLRETHLMENAQSWQLGCTFPVPGPNTIDTIRWVDARVYINDTQYFDNVPKDVWTFYIGSYQPSQKWLKDRQAKKGEPLRPLSFDDIEHYQCIVHALSETIRLMGEVDKEQGE